ncbi:PadR family transcriptional regulator [Georgenia thermotolerans]|uniref:PadR family transcriptional regulator n=1 Tax=Georgenia thermotolerans TaxID=527326 RepID=A0A7J5UMM2_9MICO|nr:PadR family transcriptional regulator [Georgenia thermotolerans]KAE8763354.1 PadR family transcriptional regulator [Georgenia thermotolerans]
MGARTQVLELAILGRLRDAPTHGYELRKHLNATLGAFRTLSYGSLYPALRSLTERGLIVTEDPGASSAPLSGRRARIVYRITEAGRAHLEDSLAVAEPAAWDDDASFDVRFTLFGSTDATTRLRILEGRRARMVDRMENLRQSFARTSRRMDSYTAELARHGLEQVEREVAWLERVIDTERGTRGALDYDDIAPAAPSPTSTGPPGPPGASPPRGTRRPPSADADGAPATSNENPLSKEQP